MATTTASLTISSGDLTGDALSLSTTTQLKKAGTVTGLDQTTGVARKVFPTAVTNEKLIDKTLFSDWTSGDQVAHKVYIKNLSTTASQYITISFDDGTNTIGIGMLYAGDFCFLPYEGTKDIEITTSDVNMTVEYLVIYEA
tara:strand:+ start:208 stop:630 length:423 start_codon:yes stop_codon:yes gene_type:complete